MKGLLLAICLVAVGAMLAPPAAHAAPAMKHLRIDGPLRYPWDPRQPLAFRERVGAGAWRSMASTLSDCDIVGLPTRYLGLAWHPGLGTPEGDALFLEMARGAGDTVVPFRLQGGPSYFVALAGVPLEGIVAMLTCTIDDADEAKRVVARYLDNQHREARRPGAHRRPAIRIDGSFRVPAVWN